MKEAGCSDEALCYEMSEFVLASSFSDSDKSPRWMSKEPAEIFEAAAEEGFITQVESYKHLGGQPEYLTLGTYSSSTILPFRSTAN